VGVGIVQALVDVGAISVESGTAVSCIASAGVRTFVVCAICLLVASVHYFHALVDVNASFNRISSVTGVACARETSFSVVAVRVGAAIVLSSHTFVDIGATSEIGTLVTITFETNQALAQVGPWRVDAIGVGMATVRMRIVNTLKN